MDRARVKAVYIPITVSRLHTKLLSPTLEFAFTQPVIRKVPAKVLSFELLKHFDFLRQHLSARSTQPTAATHNTALQSHDWTRGGQSDPYLCLAVPSLVRFTQQTCTSMSDARREDGTSVSFPHMLQAECTTLNINIKYPVTSLNPEVLYPSKGRMLVQPSAGGEV